MVTAIIVAAGMGSRMNLGYNKQYLKLLGKEVLAYTLETFQSVEEIDNIILVSALEEIDFCKEKIVDKYNITKVTKIVSGGKSRQESVYNGLKNCMESDIVVIHDGARPFIKPNIIIESVKLTKDKNATTVGVKVKDTIKKGNDTVYVDTLNRDELYMVQTPQSFRFSLIYKAHELAKAQGFEGTDDASLVEHIGEKVYIVKGDYFNIKITTKEDIYIGEGIIKGLKEGE